MNNNKKLPALTLEEELALELLQVRGSCSARALVLLGSVSDSGFNVSKAALEKTLLSLMRRRHKPDIVTCRAGSDSGSKGPATIYTITNYGRAVIAAWRIYRDTLESLEGLGK